MTGIEIYGTMKRFFFDRTNVIEKLGEKRAAALKKAGAVSRKIARNKLRRRKRVSKPGETPSVRSKSAYATLKNIQYGFDTENESTFIGPIGIRSKREPAPGLLEHGGNVSHKNFGRQERKIGGAGEIAIDRKVKGKKNKSQFVATIKDYKGVKRTVVFAKLYTQSQVDRANKLNAELHGPDVIEGEVAPRPFMAPAMLIAKDQFVDLYVNEG